MRQTGLQIYRFKSATIKCSYTNISFLITCSAIITIKTNCMFINFCYMVHESSVLNLFWNVKQNVEVLDENILPLLKVWFSRLL